MNEIDEQHTRLGGARRYQHASNAMAGSVRANWRVALTEPTPSLFVYIRWGYDSQHTFPLRGFHIVCTDHDMAEHSSLLLEIASANSDFSRFPTRA